MPASIRTSPTPSTGGAHPRTNRFVRAVTAAVEVIVRFAVAGIGLGLGVAGPALFTLPANANGGTGIFPAGRLPAAGDSGYADGVFCQFGLLGGIPAAHQAASPVQRLICPRLSWPSCLAIHNRGFGGLALRPDLCRADVSRRRGIFHFFCRRDIRARCVVLG